MELRAAQRRMKGVTLQYTGDDRVFFDDVAGIGDAKVVNPKPCSHVHCAAANAARSDLQFAMVIICCSYP